MDKKGLLENIVSAYLLNDKFCNSMCGSEASMLPEGTFFNDMEIFLETAMLDILVPEFFENGSEDDPYNDFTSGMTDALANHIENNDFDELIKRLIDLGEWIRGKYYEPLA